MPPSQERNFAKVATLTPKVRSPFDETVVCFFDRDCDGYSARAVVNVEKVSVRGERCDGIDVVSRGPYRCSESSECALRVRLRGRETQIGIKTLALTVAYTVSNHSTVRHLLVNVVIRAYDNDMVRLDPEFAALLRSRPSGDVVPKLVPVVHHAERAEPSTAVEEKLRDLMKALTLHDGGLNYINVDSQGSLIKWKLLRDLSPENYVIKYEAMNCYERRQQVFELKKQTLADVMFRQEGIFFVLDLDDIDADRDDVRERDSLVAILHGTSQEFVGFVKCVEETEVVLKFNKAFKNVWSPRAKFRVWFRLNRSVFDKSSKILRKIGCDMRIKNSSWRRFLFPDEEDIPKYSVDVSRQGKLDIGLNPEQRKAVLYILSGGGRSVPYIIFGPPGTGKTKTLVEAIKETYRENCYGLKTILVTSSSNAAADELAERLLKLLPGRVARLYAESRPDRLIPSFLANLWPARGKIIVCTFVVARYFIDKDEFKGIRFDDIFMDEVGHATELTTLCSIADLVDKRRSRIVMAGDPCQLGPVVKSKISRDHGMEISLLERLMERDIYRPDPKTKKFNGRVITKLIQNYRSHEDLLSVPNELFYDGELVASAPRDVQDAFIGWSELPNPHFPLIFKGIVGLETRGEEGVSFYNVEEALTVVNYLEKVVKTLGRSGVSGKDIAILTPYRGQVTIIQSILEQRHLTPQVTIGSTEEMQGKEKSVVIISTVRSQPELADEDFEFSVGFLRNPKRFNVAVTRAKSLLIVIGNPLVLKEDCNWRTFLEYIIDNGGYTGYKSDGIRKVIDTARSNSDKSIYLDC